MARTRLSVTVELLGGRGEELWPWPGRVFAVGPSHTFNDLANAINDAFAPVGSLAFVDVHPCQRTHSHRYRDRRRDGGVARRADHRDGGHRVGQSRSAAGTRGRVPLTFLIKEQLPCPDSPGFIET